MNLLDKLRSVTPADFDRDVTEFFGAVPTFDRDCFSVGGESLQMADVCAAAAEVVARADGPTRILIRDLEPPRAP